MVPGCLATVLGILRLSPKALFGPVQVVFDGHGVNGAVGARSGAGANGVKMAKKVVGEMTAKEVELEQGVRSGSAKWGVRG